MRSTLVGRDDDAAHERVPGAAQLASIRTCSGLPAGWNIDRRYTSSRASGSRCRCRCRRDGIRESVSSLRSRISMRLPALTRISDGVKLKRSATISMTCGSCAAAALATQPALQRRRRDEQSERERHECVSHQNHHPSPTLNELGAAITALLLPHDRVVDLDGDVGIGPVRGADDPGVAVELLERHIARPASGTACRSSRSGRTRRRRRTARPETTR